MGSLDVEIDALAERIDMAERQPRQPRQSDEERLAMALEQSRLEHSQVEQRRLDLATSASLGANQSSSDPFAAPGASCRPHADSLLRDRCCAESSRDEAKEQDIISVPPNFGERVGEEHRRDIEQDTKVTLRLGPPTQDGNDAFIVLEGFAGGIDAAKALLQPHIDSARAAQRDESPELQKLLSMGFMREEAERALLDENGDVQRAVIRLTGDDEVSPRSQAMRRQAAASHEVDIFGPLWCGKLLVEPGHTLGSFRAQLVEKTGAPALVLTIDGRELMDETASLEDCGVVPGARVTCRNMLSTQAKQEKQQQEDAELRALEQWGSRASFVGEPEPEPEPAPEPAPESLPVPAPGATEDTLAMSALIDDAVNDFPDELTRLRSRKYTGEVTPFTPPPEPEPEPEPAPESGSRNRSPGWVRARNQFPRKCTWGEWAFCIHVCDPPVGARLSLSHPSGVFLNLSQGSIGDFSWKFAKGSTDLVSSADGSATAPWLDVTLVERSTQVQRVHTAVAGQHEFYDLGSGWLTSAQPLQTSMLDGDTIELAAGSDYVFGMRSQWTLSHNGAALSIRNAHAGNIPPSSGSADLGSLNASTDPLDVLAARMFCIKLGSDGSSYFFDTTGERHALSEPVYRQIVFGKKDTQPLDNEPFASPRARSTSSLPSLVNSDLVIHPDAVVKVDGPTLLGGSPTSPFSPASGEDDDSVPSSLARLITTQEKDRSDLETLVGSCPSPSRFGSADSRISDEDLDLRLSTGESVRERVGSLPLNLEAAFFGSDLIPTPTKQASLSGSSVLGSGILIPPDLDDPLEGVSSQVPSDDEDGMFVMSPTEQTGYNPWLVPPTEPNVADEEVVLQVAEKEPVSPAAATVPGDQAQQRPETSFMMTPSPPVGRRSTQEPELEPEPEPEPSLQPELEPEPEPQPQPVSVSLPERSAQPVGEPPSSSPEPPPPQFVKEPPSSFASNVRAPTSSRPIPPSQSAQGSVGASWLDVGASMAAEPRRTTEQLPPELQPKKRFVREGNTVRLMDVEATQGSMMFAVQTILDTRIAFDRISLVMPPRDEHGSSLCHSQNKELGPPAHCDGALVTRVYGELVSNFRFRSPATAVDCLRAVSTVREAIETDLGAPIAFRILIQRPRAQKDSSAQDLERWYIVLDHTHQCVTAEASKRRHNKLIKDAIISMRGLHQFVRLVPGYNQFRAVVPRGGARTSKPSLDFAIERIHPRDVPTQTMHATSLESPFGNVSVSLEFDLACEVLLPTPRPPPMQELETPPLSSSPPQVSSSPPKVDTSVSAEMERSFPASSLPDVPAADQPPPPPPPPTSGFDSCTPGVTPGHKHPGDTVGQYTLEEQLGAGQYGRVFRANTIQTDGSEPVRVAIKSIDRQSLCDMGGNMDEKKKSYVESEIRVMQSVQHPNIVRLFEPLYSDTNIFLVLEFCDLDLSKYLNGNKFSSPQVRPRAPLSEREAQVFMHHLAAGLQNLREHNVVHRDLKPENLLLSGSRDSGFTLKIADFGMARTLEGGQQLANTMCGSPAFMAPEVFLLRQQGQPGYDEKADLWSVGCILYFMLTKNMVTPAQNHMHLAQELQVRRHLRLHPPPPPPPPRPPPPCIMYV
eukprot:COSAG06_NODE_159_length_21747_cov_5.504111_8_plen_1602_part_00